MPTTALSLILIAAAVPFELTTLEDQTASGNLVGLSADTVTLKTDDGEKEYPVEGLLSLSPASAREPATQGKILVELADGSVVPASDYSVKTGRATITLPSGNSFTTSTRDLKAVRFLEQDERERQLWDEIVASNPKGDAVVVRKGGDDKPVTLDFLEGALRDVSKSTVQFEFDGDVIPVNRSKVQVAGLIYYRREGSSTPQALCRVDTTGGERWMAKEVTLNGDQLQFTSASGIERTVSLSRIENLDFSLGKIAYLSDLQPVKDDWRPFLGSSNISDSTRKLFKFRRDQTFTGDTIRLGQREFRKGLAVHSRSEISYRLPGEFSRFEAIIGIDPNQKNRGHVRLEIRGDNRVLFDEAIAGDAAAVPLELDVSGVGRLTVLVDFGEGWDIGDQLLLGGARVIR